MKRSTFRACRIALSTALAGAVLSIAPTFTSSVLAGEIIPQLGITKPRHGDEDAKLFGGLAIRANLATALKAEVGAMYRSEERLNGNLDVRQWPVTASLWIAPIPELYAGGGVGWYHTTLDFDDDLGIESDTSQDFGVHLGGGLTVPVSASVGVDLNGRYVFMDDIETEFEDIDSLDPDFWTTALGLSFRF